MCFDTQAARPVNLKLWLVNLISNLAEENTCSESYYILFSEFRMEIQRFEIRRNGKNPLHSGYDHESVIAPTIAYDHCSQ